jgi:hypothetical protein
MAHVTRGRPLATFRYPARVEVRRPTFAPAASLKYLDAGRLARVARADIEIGYLETGCCRLTVLAAVKKGMVAGIRVRPCPDCRPERLTPKLQSMLEAARTRVRGRPRPFHPTPVAEFMTGVAYTIVETLCDEVCYTIGGYGICFICCRGDGRWCFIRIVTPGGVRTL